MNYKKISNIMQSVACDILTKMFFCQTIDDYIKLYDDTFAAYCLNTDPFTSLPVTDKEYTKKIVEYNKQMMIDRFGYYD